MNGTVVSRAISAQIALSLKFHFCKISSSLGLDFNEKPALVLKNDPSLVHWLVKNPKEGFFIPERVKNLLAKRSLLVLKAIANSKESNRPHKTLATIVEPEESFPLRH